MKILTISLLLVLHLSALGMESEPNESQGPSRGTLAFAITSTFVSAMLSVISAVYAEKERQDPAPKTDSNKREFLATTILDGLSAGTGMITAGILIGALRSESHIPALVAVNTRLASMLLAIAALIPMGMASNLQSTNSKVMLGTGIAGAAVNAISWLPWGLCTCFMNIMCCGRILNSAVN